MPPSFIFIGYALYYSNGTLLHCRAGQVCLKIVNNPSLHIHCDVFCSEFVILYHLLNFHKSGTEQGCGISQSYKYLDTQKLTNT
jgi:hypothetical protein